ncbi:arginine--tRNA ligase [Hyphobacterium sp. CCMP332]|uniref:arginine--tRNA ligase n=1 Tax=Hyphobacterium sp. CCMP332 TaxID=2749086 RepID=UPI00164FBDA8|nr:arginine--tRNA ligase [Hyphobacterium sp. CCMP332]QNL19258.1 arginine--tRNA ligase [Hyphobacterium sp. CCMP332]
MTSIVDQLSARIGAAFEAIGLPADLGRCTESDRPDLAPYQCNGAMAAARLAKKAPRAVADDIAAQLDGDALIAELEIAGPGFLNITPATSVYEAQANGIVADDRAGAALVEAARTVMIDFGGPNVAKPMHVGHLRSSVLGDSLQRLFRFRGDTVISDIHLGDWGYQMGLLVTELQSEQPDLPYFDADFAGEYPSEPPVTIEDLSRLYPQAAAAAKDNEARAALARKATAELQAGRRGYRALLAHFIAVSIAALKHDFDALGVHFDLWKGESDVNDLIPALVEDFKARGVAEKSDGAWVVRVAREDDKKELAPLILVSSQGSALYGTTDLATIQDRKTHYDPDLILYVVDLGQSDHFEQVYRAAYKAGLAVEDSLEHIKFGTVNGPDGKRLRTRAGGTFRLADLISEAYERARARLNEAGLGAELSADEFDRVARMVANAAIKFADLQNYRTTNYIFELDRFISFEGKTGPYLLYQAVRVKSIMRKAEAEGLKAGPIRITDPAEAALVRRLDGFDAALQRAYDLRAPNHICDHVYSLAQAFSSFYAACPILPEKDEAIRSSRLALAQTTLKQLEIALSLIGMDAPEKM